MEEYIGKGFAVLMIFVLINTFLIYTGFHYVFEELKEIKKHLGMKE